MMDILRLVEQKKYFILRSPRQSGKTSYLLALADYLNKQGQYKCLYFNIESVHTDQNDLAESIKGILSELSSRARDFLNDDYPERITPKVLGERGPNQAINEILTLWAKSTDKPIILLIDDIDSIKGGIFASLLRQLRSGYDKRPKLFPHSIVLCGVEDIRFIKLTDTSGDVVTAGDIFNIDAKSLRLTNFSFDEIKALFHQGIDDIGIEIEESAIQKIWHLTDGQPWIVNALGYEICFEMIPRKQDIKEIRIRDVDEAAENIIQRGEMHIRNLTDKLSEDKVKKLISCMLTGGEFPQELSEDDIRYIYDLGLIQVLDNKITIANNIYNEIIPRSLIYSTQLLIKYDLASFLEDNGGLDFTKILMSFQLFYNKYFKAWVERFNYKEAGAFLFLQAFLNRIIDGGGKIERIYGLARRHFTLIITWPYAEGEQRIIIELYYFRASIKSMVKENIGDFLKRMTDLEIHDGHFIIFNQNPAHLWEQKIYRNAKSENDYSIDVWVI